MKKPSRFPVFTSRAAVLACLLGAGLATGLVGCGDRTTDLEYLQRAREYQAKQDWSASVIELKNALRKNPDNRDARLLLGQIYVTTGNGAPAEKELLRARDLGAARDVWLVPLARAYMLQDQNQKVLDLTLDTADAPATQAGLLALQGLSALALAQPDVARGLLSRALTLQSGQVDALLGLSELALIGRNYSEADDFASQASAGAPDDLRPWFIKARLRRLQNDDPGALKALQQVLTLQPQNATALLERAEIRIAQGQQDEALADVEVVRKRLPN